MLFSIFNSGLRFSSMKDECIFYFLQQVLFRKIALHRLQC
jgi:hypothetical protein